MKARLIAYYLPQYHPIPENNEWWGDGFTEWISVANAKPLFKGHMQPRLPGELGFYDLRLEESRIHQADLAREHGVEGFCYWHYWFGNGRRILERPFNEVLESGKPDFPFCLGWANHSWISVFFGSEARTLIEQRYPGKEDFKKHFEYLLKAFTDKRYILVEGKPLLHIFKPREIPECKNYMEYWRELALKAGLKGLYLVGEDMELEEIDQYGLDGVTYSNHRLISKVRISNRFVRGVYRKMLRLSGETEVYEYSEAMKYFLRNSVSPENEFPSIVPNWDTTPRLGKKAFVLNNSTPELFRIHIRQVLDSVKQKDSDKRIVFIKSWNEWAEGNYLEPDRKYGRQYLQVLKDEVLNG